LSENAREGIPEPVKIAQKGKTESDRQNKTLATNTFRRT